VELELEKKAFPMGGGKCLSITSFFRKCGALFGGRLLGLEVGSRWEVFGEILL
jgi:hypothetical protein